MATSLNRDSIAGLDDKTAQALRQAGVDTVEKLATMDSQAVASRTGLRPEDLVNLKAAAAAALPRPARRARARRSMTVAWIMLALIVVAVVAVMYAGRVRGWARAQVAEQEQQLVAANAHIAFLAQQYVKAAARNVGADNWGVAQRDLGRAGDEIAVLEQVAPRKVRDQVGHARSRLGRAQDAVGARDRAALERINETDQALAELAGEGQR